MRHQSHPSWPPRESRRNLSAPTSLHAARSMPYQRIGALVLSGPHIENPRPSNRAPPHLQAAGPCQSRLPRLATPSRSRTLRKKTRPTESPGTMVIADGLWDPAVRCAGSMVRAPMLRDSENRSECRPSELAPFPPIRDGSLRTTNHCGVSSAAGQRFLYRRVHGVVDKPLLPRSPLHHLASS